MTASPDRRHGIGLILAATLRIVRMNARAKMRRPWPTGRCIWSCIAAWWAQATGALHAPDPAPFGVPTATLRVALVENTLRKLGQTDEPLTTVFYFPLIGGDLDGALYADRR